MSHNNKQYQQHQDLDLERYNRIEKWCLDSISSGSDFLFDSKLFLETLNEKSIEFEFPYESLHSLLRNLHLNHVKATAPHVKRDVKNIYLPDCYCRQGMSILNLAKQANYPPYLFCRYLVEQIVIGNKNPTHLLRNPSKELNNPKIIANPYIESEQFKREATSSSLTTPTCGATSSIVDDSETSSSSAASSKTTRLALEVQEALDADPMYGPKHDLQRHCIGIEYEVLLEENLNSMGIPFETESQLREKGTSRTPDVLLLCPVGVKVGTEWKVVCWIDSKALFGDPNTHNSTVLPQVESYVHRFGPGMVLYWFGHAPLSQLKTANGDVVIQGWKLFDQCMWPTGEITGPGSLNSTT